MRSASFLLVFLVGLGGCRTAPPPAADTPGQVARGAADGDEEYEILSIETRVQLDKQRRKTVTHRFKTRVRTARGVELTSSVGARWSPWFQDRPELRAWVTPAGGARTALDPTTLSERPAQRSGGVFTDARVLEAPLPGVAVGAVVESESITRETRPFFDGPRHIAWWPEVEAFDGDQRLIVEVPEGMETTHRVRGATLTPVLETAGGVHRMIFAVHGGVPMAPDEPNLPPGETVLPMVLVSTEPSWQAVARGYHEMVRGAVAPADVATLAREAVGNERDPRKRVARLLSRLRARVRYEALELGQGAIVPRPPREVLARGYGDCKDLAVLLVSALQSVGMEADVALLRVGSDPDVDPDVPGLEPFDHVIVHVPQADLWVDATYDLERPGHLPVSSQGRRALVARPDTTALTTTWVSQSADNVYREVREIHLGSGAERRVVESTFATGAMDDILTLGGMTGAPERDLARAMGAYTLEVYGTSTITHVTRGPRDAPFEMKLEVPEPSIAAVSDEVASVDIHGGSLFSWMPAWMSSDGESAARQRPMSLRIPYRAELEYRIHAPWGYVLRELPQPIDRALGPARYRRQATQEGDVLVVRHTFDSGPRLYAPAEVDGYRAAVAELTPTFGVRAVYDEGSEALMAAGRIREGLATAREGVRRAPTSGRARALYAKQLMRAGLGDAARREARKAVELEPASALTHFRLGWVLQHDRWGRFQGDGWDIPGARAAYERSIAIEDGYLAFHQNLALVEQFGDNGVEFDGTAPLDRAIERYRRIEAQFKDTSFRPALAVLLFRRGRDAEARAVIESERLASMAPVALAIAARMEGVPAMRTLATAWGLRGADRASAFREAGRLLLATRAYAAAYAALMEAAAGSSDAVRIRAEAGPIGQIHRAEELLPKLAPAARIYLEWVRETAQRWTRGAAHSKHSSAALTAEIDLLHSGNSESVDRAMRQLTRSAGMSSDVVIDSMASLGTFEVEGDPTVGVRLTAKGPTGAVVVFLIREGGALKVRGLDAGSVAAEAWSRLEHGQVAAAGQWARWALELAGSGGSRTFCGASSFSKPETLRACIATFLVNTPRPRRDLLGAMQAARDQVPADRDLDAYLVHVLLRQERPADAVKLSTDLIAREPGSRQARLAHVAALSADGRAKEARRAWQGWLDEDPGHKALREFATFQAARMGNFRDAVALAEMPADATPVALNNRAWFEVCGGDAQAAEVDATRALKASGFTSTSALHTLATAQAEQGQPEAAMASIAKAIELGGAPDADEYSYVVARISEAYGLAEDAREVYGKLAVIEATDSNASCIQALARRRLTVK